MGFVAACGALGPSGQEVFSAFHEAFSYLPLGCVAGGAAFIVHGGIGAGDWNLEDLVDLERPLDEDELWQDNLLLNLMWSDPFHRPGARCSGVHTSSRDQGTGQILEWGADVTDQFCERNGIAMIVRSHDLDDTYGYSTMHGNRLLRVFSARDYEGNKNDGSVIIIEDTFSGLNVRAQTLRTISMAEPGAAPEVAVVDIVGIIVVVVIARTRLYN